MRVAITATGKDLDAEIDLRFGRAQYILIVDPGGTIIDVIDNEPNRAAMGGAGIAAAKMLSDRKVDVLLTGTCGPNALRSLNSAGIKIGEVRSGTVRQALERFNSGDVGYVDEDSTRSDSRLSGISGAPRLGGGRGMGMGRGVGGGRGTGMGRGMGRGRGKW